MIVRDKWGKDHIVNDQYDNKEIIIDTDHVFNEMTPTDILTKNNYPMNAASTRVNESRPVTMIINPDEPQFRERFPGLRIGQKIKNW